MTWKWQSFKGTTGEVSYSCRTTFKIRDGSTGVWTGAPSKRLGCKVGGAGILGWMHRCGSSSTSEWWCKKYWIDGDKGGRVCSSRNGVNQRDVFRVVANRSNIGEATTSFICWRIS
jgi:hypothetical protein